MSLEKIYEEILVDRERRYRRSLWYVLILLLVMMTVAGYLAWQNHSGKLISVMSQQEAQAAVSIEKGAEAADTPLTKHQAEVIAEQIERVSTEKLPDQQMQTVGAQVERQVEVVRKNIKADFVIVTDPKHPERRPVVQAETPVELNVYAIKAYPEQLVEVSIGIQGGDIAYLRRTNMPKIPLLLPKGAVGYAGPFIRTEYGSGKIDAGMRMVVPF